MLDNTPSMIKVRPTKLNLQEPTRLKFESLYFVFIVGSKTVQTGNKLLPQDNSSLVWDEYCELNVHDEIIIQVELWQNRFDTGDIFVGGGYVNVSEFLFNPSRFIWVELQKSDREVGTILLEGQVVPQDKKTQQVVNLLQLPESQVEKSKGTQHQSSQELLSDLKALKGHVLEMDQCFQQSQMAAGSDLLDKKRDVKADYDPSQILETLQSESKADISAKYDYESYASPDRFRDRSPIDFKVPFSKEANNQVVPDVSIVNNVAEQSHGLFPVSDSKMSKPFERGNLSEASYDGEDRFKGLSKAKKTYSLDNPLENQISLDFADNEKPKLGKTSSITTQYSGGIPSSSKTYWAGSPLNFEGRNRSKADMAESEKRLIIPEQCEFMFDAEESPTKDMQGAIPDEGERNSVPPSHQVEFNMENRSFRGSSSFRDTGFTSSFKDKGFTYSFSGRKPIPFELEPLRISKPLHDLNFAEEFLGKKNPSKGRRIFDDKERYLENDFSGRLRESVRKYNHQDRAVIHLE